MATVRVDGRTVRVKIHPIARPVVLPIRPQTTRVIMRNSNVGTESTAAAQKLGFYGATPIARPSATPANATDLATALTLVNDLKAKLIALGLIS